MPLTDVRIRQSKPLDKPFRLADGGGLFLEVRPNGAKFWRYAYRIGGRQNLFALGRYPETTLVDARAEHARARALVKEGRHPAHERARTKAEAIAEGQDTFGAIAQEWFDASATRWGQSRIDQVRRYLDGDLVPKFGKRPVKSITSVELLAVVKTVEKRSGPAAAIVTRQVASHVFTHAIASLRADTDPTFAIRRAVKRAETAHAEAHSPDVLGDFYSKLRAYGGNRTTAIAVELLALTFVRTAELRGAPWSEFDFDRRLWTIPKERMKKRRPHLVPLSGQVVDLLRELRNITGKGEFLFPNNSDPRKTMSRMTVNRAIEYMGFNTGAITGHDFRATASTHLHEMGYASDVVELQLAHAKKDRVAAAYNHAKYLPERTAMMQAWADWMGAIAAKAPVAARRPRGRPPAARKTDPAG